MKMGGLIEGKIFMIICSIIIVSIAIFYEIYCHLGPFITIVCTFPHPLPNFRRDRILLFRLLPYILKIAIYFLNVCQRIHHLTFIELFFLIQKSLSPERFIRIRSWKISEFFSVLLNGSFLWELMKEERWSKGVYPELEQDQCLIKTNRNKKVRVVLKSQNISLWECCWINLHNNIDNCDDRNNPSLQHRCHHLLQLLPLLGHQLRHHALRDLPPQHLQSLLPQTRLPEQLRTRVHPHHQPRLPRPCPYGNHLCCCKIGSQRVGAQQPGPPMIPSSRDHIQDIQIQPLTCNDACSFPSD